jgi:hypothetical protein
LRFLGNADFYKHLSMKGQTAVMDKMSEAHGRGNEGYAEGKFYVDGIDIADIRFVPSVRGSGLGATTCTFTDHCESRPTMVRVTGFKASPR